jgi:hypothetical protein
MYNQQRISVVQKNAPFTAIYTLAIENDQSPNVDSQLLRFWRLVSPLEFWLPFKLAAA